MLCGCTMRVFQLTEDKLIYFAFENIDGKKKFFSTKSQLRHASNLSHFNRYFYQKKKKRYIVLLLFLFYLKGDNLEAASLACIFFKMINFSRND